MFEFLNTKSLSTKENREREKYLYVENEMQNCLNLLYKEIPNFDERLFGIFVIDTPNKDCWDYGDKKYYQVVLLPTFEELCNLIAYNESITLADKTVIKFIDVRVYINELINQNGDTLETLYAIHKYITPRFEDIFNTYFIQERESIVNINRKALLEWISQSALQFSSEKNILIRRTELYKIAYLKTFAHKIVNNIDFNNCLHLTTIEEQEYVNNFKYNVENKEDKEIDEIYESCIKTIEEEVKGAETRENLNLAMSAKLREVSVIILKQAENKRDMDLFSQTLTPNELTIFNHLCQARPDTDTEYYVSVSELCSTLGISRPVFTNLFKKMEMAELASCTSGGVNGTKITWKKPKI